MGNVKCANCVSPVAGPTAVSSEYGEAQVSARRTGVTSLNIQRTGANLGHRAAIRNYFVSWRSLRRKYRLLFRTFVGFFSI
jgi:hypothetical protein